MSTALSTKSKVSPKFAGAVSTEGDPVHRLIEASHANDVRGMWRASKDGAQCYAKNGSGDNVYTAAAKGNALWSIDYAATELKAWIDMPDSKGRTGLLVALQQVRPAAAAKFLVYGANPLTIGKNEGFKLRDGFEALDTALAKAGAVKEGVVNEEWSPVVAGMIHRLFNPEFWPDDKGAVWDRHIPESIQNLKLHSGATVAGMRAARAAVVPEPVEIPIDRFELNA